MNLPDVVYIAKYPDVSIEIKKHPCIPRNLPFTAITGMFWEDVKDKMLKTAKDRLKKAEQELAAANKHYDAVVSLEKPKEVTA